MIGFAGIVRGMQAALDITNQYATAVAQVSKQMGTETPGAVAAYTEAMKGFEESTMSLKIVMAENFMPVIQQVVGMLGKVAKAYQELWNWSGRLGAKMFGGEAGLAREIQRQAESEKARSAIAAQMIKNKKGGGSKTTKTEAYSLENDVSYQAGKQMAQGDQAREEEEEKQYQARLQWEKELREARSAANKEWMEGERAKRDAVKQRKQMEFDAANSAIGNALALADMFKENSEGMFAMAKALAIAQATMNTFSGATKALEQGGIFGPILAGSVIAFGMAQVAQIAATQFKGGLAKGTSYAEGGTYMVGERGPEIVNLPRGAEVIPNNRLSKGGISITINGNGDQRWIQDTLVPVLRRELSRA